MSGGGGGRNIAKEHPWEYLEASALSAIITFPLWRASAIAQSGFITPSIKILNGRITLPLSINPYYYAFCKFPYKGMIATVFIMTWGRGFIFWASDYSKDKLIQKKYSTPISTLLPPLATSTFVQCVNMPIVRAAVTIQNPTCKYQNVSEALRAIHRDYGITGLWRGTSAGILKTVPKFSTAVIVKDIMEDWLPSIDPASPTIQSDRLLKSVYKSCIAGGASAILTNPFDVIRNEMFKTNLQLLQVTKQLQKQIGIRLLLFRGLGKNIIAVSIPIACTIFFTDLFVHFSKETMI